MKKTIWQDHRYSIQEEDVNDDKTVYYLSGKGIETTPVLFVHGTVWGSYSGRLSDMADQLSRKGYMSLSPNTKSLAKQIITLAPKGIGLSKKFNPDQPRDENGQWTDTNISKHKPSTKITQSPEFKRWFGNSRAINHDGTPQILYHSTTKDFDEFASGQETVNGGSFGNWTVKRSGIFFAESPVDSQAYTSDGKRQKQNARTIPVFLKEVNPLDLVSDGLTFDIVNSLVSTGYVTEKFLYSKDFNWELFDDEDGIAFTNAVKAAGYDSVRFWDNNPDTGKSFVTHVVFDPTQIKSAIGNSGEFNPDNPKITKHLPGEHDQLTHGRQTSGEVQSNSDQPKQTTPIKQPRTREDVIRSKEFKKWFGDSKVVDENGDPLVVYHGTTHTFDQFDLNKAPIENAVGRGFYFSSDSYDAGNNYATPLGPDITERIANYADQLKDSEDEDGNPIDHDRAMELAREKFVGDHEGAVLPVYLKIENPVYLNKNSRAYDKNTRFEIIENFDEDGNETDDPEGNGIQLLESIDNACANYNLDSDIVKEKLYEGLIDGSLTAYDVMKTIGDTFSDVYDENTGEYAGGQLISDIFQGMGYDGIIFENANQFFPKMGIEYEADHYVVFDPTQVKSAIGNSGEFSPDNPKINKSLRKSVENVFKHLPGQHDQSTHGRKHSLDSSGTSSNSSNVRIPNDDEAKKISDLMWHIRQSGFDGVYVNDRKVTPEQAIESLSEVVDQLDTIKKVFPTLDLFNLSIRFNLQDAYDGTNAFYSPEDRVIEIHEGNGEGFAHELFHAIDHGFSKSIARNHPSRLASEITDIYAVELLNDTPQAMAIHKAFKDFFGAVKNTKTFTDDWSDIANLIDEDKRRNAHPDRVANFIRYYKSPVEFSARFFEQYMQKEHGLKQVGYSRSTHYMRDADYQAVKPYFESVLESFGLMTKTSKHYPGLHNQQDHAPNEKVAREHQDSHKFLDSLKQANLQPDDVRTISKKKTKMRLELIYHDETRAKQAFDKSKAMGFDTSTSIYRLPLNADMTKFKHGFLVTAPDYYTPRGPSSNNEVRQVFGKHLPGQHDQRDHAPAHLSDSEHQRYARSRVKRESLVANGLKGYRALIQLVGGDRASELVASYRRYRPSRSAQIVSRWLLDLHIPHEMEVKLAPEIYVDIMFGNKIIELRGKNHANRSKEYAAQRKEIQKRKADIAQNRGMSILYLTDTEIQTGKALDKLKVFVNEPAQKHLAGMHNQQDHGRKKREYALTEITKQDDSTWSKSANQLSKPNHPRFDDILKSAIYIYSALEDQQKSKGTYKVVGLRDNSNVLQAFFGVDTLDAGKLNKLKDYGMSNSDADQIKDALYLDSLSVAPWHFGDDGVSGWGIEIMRSAINYAKNNHKNGIFLVSADSGSDSFYNLIDMKKISTLNNKQGYFWNTQDMEAFLNEYQLRQSK